ncbi:hypothetical protein M0P48_00965 [Candidatus Gracilibacteria bacterium]|jgi:hypothetical protein|nr:hypothetical protein [Candidatus Gracilibacteria bacterium]
MFGSEDIAKIGEKAKGFFGNSKDLLAKFIPSLTEAFGEAWKAKWGEKWKVFSGKFKEEWGRLGKEKEEISQGAQAAATKTTEQTMASATTAVKLDETKVEKGSADSYKEALATGVASLASLSQKQQVFANKGLDKLSKAVKEGKTDVLDFDEFKAVAATAISTLKALKIKYPDKDKLKTALEQISKASESSKYPIAKLLQTSVLKVLKPDITVLDILNPLNSSYLDFFKKFGISGVSELSELKDTMSLLKEKEITADDKAKVVAAYKKYIIPNTTKSDVVRVVDFVQKLVLEKPASLTIDQLAELVSLVDVKDLDRMIAILTGKIGEAKA